MNNPGRINSRTSLLDVAYDLRPSNALGRSIREGRVTVLGGFTAIAPHNLPGFICYVRSRFGRTWFQAILVDEIHHGYKSVLIEDIPWFEWAGRWIGGKEAWSVYNGDIPQIIAEEIAREHSNLALPVGLGAAHIWNRIKSRGGIP